MMNSIVLLFLRINYLNFTPQNQYKGRRHSPYFSPILSSKITFTVHFPRGNFVISTRAHVTISSLFAAYLGQASKKILIHYILVEDFRIISFTIFLKQIIYTIKNRDMQIINRSFIWIDRLTENLEYSGLVEIK